MNYKEKKWKRRYIRNIEKYESLNKTLVDIISTSNQRKLDAELKIFSPMQILMLFPMNQVPFLKIVRDSLLEDKAIINLIKYQNKELVAEDRTIVRDMRETNVNETIS